MPDLIKDFVPSISVSQFVPFTEDECKKADLPSTSKAKPRLGISNDREIVWNEANFDLETHNLLLAFAKARNRTLSSILASVCMDWVETNRTAIEAEAADHLVGEKTVEDMDKMIAAYDRKIAAMKLMADKKRAEIITAAKAEAKAKADEEAKKSK